MANRDGCGCPPALQRCVHLPNGHILALLSDDHHSCYLGTNRPTWLFGVAVVYGWKPCYREGCTGFLNTGRDEAIYAGDSEADALAAFYAYEERLLQDD